MTETTPAFDRGSLGLADYRLVLGSKLYEPMLYPSTLKPGAAELCVAALFGSDPATPSLASFGPLDCWSPRAVIESQVLEALVRGPLYVSFSGGRDSSALLAIATDVARREGLADPIPSTTYFSHLPESNEEDFQRVVVDHLGLKDWERVNGGDRFDVLGPLAQQVLLEHGVVLPINAHAMLPLMEVAAGGTLMTGAGGDELMEGTTYRLSSSIWSRRRVTRENVRSLAMADLPRPLRKRWVRSGSTLSKVPWLTPAALELLLEAQAEEAASYPIRFDRFLDLYWRERTIQSLATTPAVLATTHDVRVLQPFLTAEYFGALQVKWGARFPGNRARALVDHVGDLLPREVLERQSKASFRRAFYTDHARAWAQAWDGEGVDPELVNVAALREHWSGEWIYGPSLGLLQQAWLSAHAGRG